MPDQPRTNADELKTRERFLRLACRVNIVLFLLLLAAWAVWFVAATQAFSKRAVPAPATGEKEDLSQMRAVLEAQVAAWNKGDLDGFMAGYWRDAGLTFISGDTITRGWEPTRERYLKKYFTPGPDGKFADRGELSFEELETEPLSADAGVIRGRYRLKLAGKEDTGRFTLVMRKLPEGWRIASDHTSVECKK